jgi:hypothetical protein
MALDVPRGRGVPTERGYREAWVAGAALETRVVPFLSNLLIHTSTQFNFPTNIGKMRAL